MDTAAIDYELPASAIAQTPAQPRDAARLLVDRGSGQPPDDKRVADLASLVGPGDLLVVNETSVLRARLQLRKRTGAAVEVLLLEPLDGHRTWRALVRPGRRVKPGTVLLADDQALVEVAGEAGGRGERLVTLLVEIDEVLRHGSVPLPPYIHKPLADPDRYQTVYATRPGSVAAPTAGLHLTRELLDDCRAAGAELATVDLSVGVDTFRPVDEATLEDHVIHSERYSVPADTIDACARAQRVIAVGTTVVRTLESVAAGRPLVGRTDLFITPGHEFRLVDVLLTNFHLPRSTLLALIAAFVGPRWRDLYETALERGYRFLSFGDAMLLERSGSRP